MDQDWNNDAKTLEGRADLLLAVARVLTDIGPVKKTISPEKRPSHHLTSGWLTGAHKVDLSAVNVVAQTRILRSSNTKGVLMTEHAKYPFSPAFGASIYGASEFGEVMWSWEVDTAFSPGLHLAQLF